MTLKYLLDRLFSIPLHQGSNTKSQNLKNVLALSSKLKFPHLSYPCIHVAGSNGKGSVALKIASSLQAQGYRVGLYTSPHLFHFRERIVVNGRAIDDENLAEGLQTVFSAIESEKIDATYFEIATLLAFDYFRKEKVDAAVIETGLGGRLDATNIICPILAVITSISLEHVQLLGGTLDSIAKEKAGILKPNIPCVLGPHANLGPIEQRAKELNCPLIKVESATSFYDEENEAIAKAALHALAEKLPLSETSIEAGLKQRPRLRFEKEANVIYDVAHNPDAFCHLVQALDHFYPKKKKRFLVGLSKDKDAQGCLKQLIPLATHIHLVRADMPRAATLDFLSENLDCLNFKEYTTHSQISSAFQEALCLSEQAEELLIVCGSFYIMHELHNFKELQLT